MNVLVIGNGGREHTIVWKIRQSVKVKKIYCMPGNAGTSEIAENVNISISDFNAIKKFVKEKKIGLTVVGPEVPLVGGIVDSFKADGLPVFGPDKKAAQLEGNKAFSKAFMQKYGMPTAEYKTCRRVSDAKKIIDEMGASIVIKASGLAAGKGVIICQKKEEAYAAVERMLEKKEFGSAGEELIIEEMLIGEETSIIAFCDGKTLFNLVPSQDHKRIYDNDQGPNTGGMGAYAPAPVVTDDVMKQIEQRVFKTFLKGIQEEKFDFRGIIYFGLMITEQGPKLLEFNVRFGDPETQVILPLLKADMVEIIDACVKQKLGEWVQKNPNSLSGKSAVCIVLASEGYPGSYEKGKKICGLEDKDELIFHAGTVEKDGSIVTSSGRVLGITATGNNLEDSIKQAYEKVVKFYFDGMQYRKDIGKKGLVTVTKGQSGKVTK